MTHENLLMSLIAVTFFAVIAWAVWQKVRTKKSQERSGDPDGRKATSDALHAHKTEKLARWASHPACH